MIVIILHILAIIAILATAAWAIADHRIHLGLTGTIAIAGYITCSVVSVMSPLTQVWVMLHAAFSALLFWWFSYRMVTPKC